MCMQLKNIAHTWQVWYITHDTCTLCKRKECSSNIAWPLPMLCERVQETWSSFQLIPTHCLSHRLDLSSQPIWSGIVLAYAPTDLDDMLSAGGSCEITVTTRVKKAWKKFRELLPVFTSHHLSYKTCGHVYSSWVWSAMLHASETWPLTKTNLQCNDRALIRQICSIKPELGCDHGKVKQATLMTSFCERRLGFNL